MKRLHVGDDFTFPLDAITQTLVVYGGKGMGKTNFAAVLVEELYKNGLKFSVLDPLGVNWGLQHGRTRDTIGLEIVILGGVHGDIPIEPTAGAVVADFVADEEISTVVDISRHPSGKMWSFGERIRFVSDYCYRLFERQGERRIPLMQVIDEAGRFVPQTIPSGAKDLAMCVGAIEQLVEWGRNVGIGVTLITQRSARMNKSVSELAECMIAFRTIGPNSVGAVMDWMGEHVEKERLKELIEQVRQLKRGSALVVSPGWLQFEGVASIRLRDTFDSSKTPEPGVEARAPGKAAKPNLDAYLVRMRDTVERAKADDPKELRKESVALKKEIVALKQRIAHLETRPAKEKEVSALTAEDRKLFEGLASIVALFKTDLMSMEKILDEVRGLCERVAKRIPITKPAAGHASKSLPQPSYKITDRQQRLRQSADSNGDLSGPEHRILDAIAWLESVGVDDPEQPAVAFLAGYTYGGGAFNNPKGSLRTKGLVEYLGDRIRLTDEGRKFATPPETALDTESLHEAVRARLPGPHQKILNVILEHYPESISKEQCAEQAGYALGGAFNNPLGRLRSLGLIEYPERGTVRARDILFISE